MLLWIGTHLHELFHGQNYFQTSKVPYDIFDTAMAYRKMWYHFWPFSHYFALYGRYQFGQFPACFIKKPLHKLLPRVLNGLPPLELILMIFSFKFNLRLAPPTRSHLNLTRGQLERKVLLRWHPLVLAEAHWRTVSKQNLNTVLWVIQCPFVNPQSVLAATVSYQKVEAVLGPESAKNLKWRQVWWVEQIDCLRIKPIKMAIVT